MISVKTFLRDTARTLIPLAILGAGIGGFLVFGQRPEVPQRADEESNGVLVTTAIAEPFSTAFTIEADGVAIPSRRVTHSAEVAGRITRKDPRCKSGRYVTEDAFLLQIDPTDYQLTVEQLSAEREQAEQTIAETDVDIANTEALIELALEDQKLQDRNLERYLRLGQRDAVTETQLDQARSQQLAARNSLQTLRNQLTSLKQSRARLETALKLAEVKLRQAQADLERTTIKAPITGTVIEDPVEIGDYVMAGDPVVRLNDSEQMEVQCQLKVEDIYWIWLQSGRYGPDQKISTEQRLELPPTPVQVVYTFNNVEYLWSGVITRYEGTGIDQATRTVPCRVLVDQPKQVSVETNGGQTALVVPPTLFSGMFVTVRIPIRPATPLLRVPLAAVRPGGHVWTVNEETLQILEAKVARTEADYALLYAMPGGLQSGAEVITSPVSAPQPGLPVRRIDSDADNLAQTRETPAPPATAAAE
ncbi:multidrug resistance protein MdtN [Maioricimonas rarisocia]|uniref:Multidrug resistance protein MdtN n=1 Tax=Maioricimonas rarisocia TaxID=2528026 RepID=A0A517ZDW6_9PLAN|nr:HlyD family efflux transporter periplasmic adaptor subunit [Maioricimonas rarisocia]QDU40630.1 multidrug resistance protein MdtN [Maioricimonas rarisocia]